MSFTVSSLKLYSNGLLCNPYCTSSTSIPEEYNLALFFRKVEENNMIFQYQHSVDIFIANL